MREKIKAAVLDIVLQKETDPLTVTESVYALNNIAAPIFNIFKSVYLRKTEFLKSETKPDA